MEDSPYHPLDRSPERSRFRRGPNVSKSVSGMVAAMMIVMRSDFKPALRPPGVLTHLGLADWESDLQTSSTQPDLQVQFFRFD